MNHFYAPTSLSQEEVEHRLARASRLLHSPSHQASLQILYSIANTIHHRSNLS